MNPDDFNKAVRHEKLNTWRVLKGLEPVQSLKCRLGWHLWTNWEIWEGEWMRGHASYAQCYCARCGMPRVEPPVNKTRKEKTK